MKNDSIIGIDLAKNVFHICKMNHRGRVLMRRRVSREQLPGFVLKHCQGVVAMEACGGSHYWARRFEEVGFEARIMPGQFVKPFVKSNKNDEIDAEAICEAASREGMRFVSTRSEQQQDVQNLHRIRERLVRQRTGLSNEIRGLLLEYGIAIPKGIRHVRRGLPELIERYCEEHSGLWRRTFCELYEEFVEIDKRIKSYDAQLKQIAHCNDNCKRLLTIPGVGELTATAIVAAVGNPRDFKNGRQFSAWLGLVPSQHSTGGKQKLGRISKRGDRYLRKLLVQGALSSFKVIKQKKRTDHTSRWLIELAQRRGAHKARIAMSNKTARRIWAVLVNKENFRAPEELLPLAA